MTATRIQRQFAIGIGVWILLAVGRGMLPFEHGLRGRYFTTPTLEGNPVSDAIDPEISSRRVYARWRATIPDASGLRWSGFLHVPESGSYTFTLTCDDTSKLSIDGRLVVENSGARDDQRARDRDGMPIAISRSGNIDLDRGAHRVLIDVAHRRGIFTFDWSWARDGASPSAVPAWRLSPSPRSVAATLIPWVERIWWIVTGVVVLLGSALVGPVVTSYFSTRSRWRQLSGAAVVVGAVVFYVTAAREHARVVNTAKATGDQSGYLYDAREVYANWHGRTPSRLIGFRMRMPGYAGLLSLFYDPGQREWEFFEVAKTVNIWLSVALLALLTMLFAWLLPPLVAANLALIVAFGCFVFKAGYCQPELLFYFLFFATFLSCCYMFTDVSSVTTIVLGVVAGIFAGLAYLTKALIPPFVLLFVVVFTSREIVRWARSRRFAWRSLAGVAMGASFLLVVSPYILTNKRVFGEYFFNQNTAFYAWFDNGIDARAVMIPMIDLEGRFRVPRSELPGMGAYVRTHTVRQIVVRIVDGIVDLARRSYYGYGYLKYVAMYFAFAIVLVATNPTAFRRLAREHAALLLFLTLYAAIYLTSTAFFVPISQTGGIRFLLAHLLPLMFVLSCLSSHAAFRDTLWAIGSLRATPTHFHLMVLAILGFEVTFSLWHRVMSTYGGS